MSRLSRFSAVSAVKRLSRPARVGGLVALLALTLGIGLGVRAHTAHAEVSACYTKQIAHAPIIGHKQLPNGWGTLEQLARSKGRRRLGKLEGYASVFDRPKRALGASGG
jgi:hypothetical protein